VLATPCPFSRAHCARKAPPPPAPSALYPPTPYTQLSSAADVHVWAGEVPGSPFRLVRGQCMVNTTEQELLATMTLPDDGAVNRTLRTIDETFSGGACRVA
jgi:hypothetical protein